MNSMSSGWQPKASIRFIRISPFAAMLGRL
jgi:hypothetical protein